MSCTPGTCVETISVDLHESPPVISFVPLNSAGAPIHEYDMLTCSPGVSSCGQERVEVPWVKGG